jgi:serine/threonine protein kinase
MDVGIPGIVDPVEIGRGGMAVVYRARQSTFNRDVAVKVITVAGVDDTVRHRFTSECHAVGSLSTHPNIVTVHEAGTTDAGLPYMVMEFLPDGSYADRLEASGALDIGEVLSVGCKLAGALETAHRAGILHRDVKPANILVSPFGEPVLADFGIARVAGSASLTMTGSVTGTPLHSAPELFDGKDATVQSDVYSAASSLYALAAGHAAFDREDYTSMTAVVRAVLFDDPVDLQTYGVPAAAVAAIHAGMAKDPADRPATMEAFGRSLEDAMSAIGLVPVPMVLLGRTDAPSAAAPLGEATIVSAATTPAQPTNLAPTLPPGAPPGSTPVPQAAADSGPKSNRVLIGVLAAVAVVAVAVAVVALLAMGGDDDGRDVVAGSGSSSDTSTDESTTSVESTTTTSSSTTTTTRPTTTLSPVVELSPIDANASSTAESGFDAGGNTTSFSALNVLDGDPTTAWRTPGDGAGEWVTIDLGSTKEVTNVGLIPGYAKIDPVDGTDRFYDNRRITEVEWRFDDGQAVRQTFDETATVQSIPVDAETRAVEVYIVSTTEPGGRDFTPISEVVIRGRD